MNHRYPSVERHPDPFVGADEPSAAPLTAFNVEEMKNALHGITPSLLILGIAGGAAFAIGSGLVSRYLFKDGRRR